MPCVIRGRGPYNAPLLTCRFCLGRMGRLKIIVFETEVTFCAHWATWRAGAKRKKSIYDEPPSLGFPMQRVFSNDGAAQRLGYRGAVSL